MACTQIFKPDCKLVLTPCEASHMKRKVAYLSSTKQYAMPFWEDESKHQGSN